LVELKNKFKAPVIIMAFLILSICLFFLRKKILRTETSQNSNLLETENENLKKSTSAKVEFSNENKNFSVSKPESIKNKTGYEKFSASLLVVSEIILKYPLSAQEISNRISESKIFQNKVSPNTTVNFSGEKFTRSKIEYVNLDNDMNQIQKISIDLTQAASEDNSYLNGFEVLFNYSPEQIISEADPIGPFSVNFLNDLNKNQPLEKWRQISKGALHVTYTNKKGESLWLKMYTKKDILSGSLRPESSIILGYTPHSD
jgi:hypothetical protein